MMSLRTAIEARFYGSEFRGSPLSPNESVKDRYPVEGAIDQLSAITALSLQ